VRLKSLLRASAETRFETLFNSVTLPSLASAIDPCTGHLSFLSLELRNAVWERVLEDAVDLLSNEPAPAADSIIFSKDTLRGLIAAVRLTFETRLYNEKDGPLFAGDPLDWWRRQGLPQLWPLAKMLLAIPAANASAERTFSDSGFLAEGREHMHMDTLEMLSIVRHYLVQDRVGAKAGALVKEMLDMFQWE